MDASLESLFNLYVSTTGRRLFAHRQVRAIAQKQGFTELVKHCDEAIAYDLATRKLERRWESEPSPATASSNPTAQRIDNLIDGILGAIRDTAVAQTRGTPADDPIHGEVEAFVTRLFPVSVHAVTSLPYVEELAAVDDILKLLKGELAPAVKELGLGRLVKRLGDLAGQYRDALESPPPSVLQWGHVRAARNEGHGLLLETVAIIVGEHPKRTPEGTAKRQALLAPILKQNDEIGQHLRARRAVTDVNPETGEDDAGAQKDAGGSGDANG
jgi:hypothetical protein